MGIRLTQVPVDIETTGFDADAHVTVVGFALPLGGRVFLQTADRSVTAPEMEAALEAAFETTVTLSTHADERALLEAVSTFVADSIAPRDYLLVAYNGERARDGFDLPFLRTRFATREKRWPFDGVAYTDLLPVIARRFNTTIEGAEDATLERVYEVLVGGPLSDHDPFEDGAAAPAAFEDGAFEALLRHNVADVLRTQALGALAERYCGRSEFRLKSLTPVVRDPALEGRGR